MNARHIFPSLLLFAAAVGGATPVQAQAVSHARDGRGNAVIVIHETRPEVLAAQREQAMRAQEARRARKQRERELELARARAKSEVRIAEAEAALRGGSVTSVGRAPGSRPGELPPTAYNHAPKYPSYRNGGIPSFAGVMFNGGWGGGWGGGFVGGGWGGFAPGGFAPGGCPPPPCR